MLCDYLEVQNERVGGRLRSEGICIYKQLIHIVVRKKLTHLKAILKIILKINKNFKKQTQLLKLYTLT